MAFLNELMSDDFPMSTGNSEKVSFYGKARKACITPDDGYYHLFFWLILGVVVSLNILAIMLYGYMRVLSNKHAHWKLDNTLQNWWICCSIWWYLCLVCYLQYNIHQMLNKALIINNSTLWNHNWSSCFDSLLGNVIPFFTAGSSINHHRFVYF